MTIKELRKNLRKMPKDAEVKILWLGAKESDRGSLTENIRLKITHKNEKIVELEGITNLYNLDIKEN